MVPSTSTSDFPLRRRGIAQRRGGFALLLTITLLAFLVILLVGLATYTRIETAIAGNTQRQAQARQNALYALNLAVAQLQTHAGPDNRVTATAAAVTGVDAQKMRYTGVWDTSAAAGSAPVWLASGLETGTSPDVTTAVASANGIALVGTNTDGSATANNVVAELQTITVPGVPGKTGNTTIGKYAWWVGDNGVKADVARTDLTGQLDYSPFSSGATESTPASPDAEARSRLLQQTGQGAGAFNTASSTAAFEPRDTANAALVPNVLATQQIPYLKDSAGTALGLAALKSHYHAWTVGNQAVLARTNAAAGAPSLRTDLSLDPAPLGTAFTAWADYPANMDTAASGALKRRYKLTPAVTDPNGSQFSIAPILSEFALGFSFHNSGTSSGASGTPVANHIECSVRCVVSLWNPYTSALAPEDLEVVVTGLPTVRVQEVFGTTPFVGGRVDLQEKLGDSSVADVPAPPVRLALSFSSTATGTATNLDAWLPGRVHSWSIKPTTIPSGGMVLPMEFDVRDSKAEALVSVFDDPFSNTVAPSAPPGSTVQRMVSEQDDTTLTIELRRVSDGAVLAKFQSPQFVAFPLGSNPLGVNDPALDFAFVFRLADPALDAFPWLQTSGVDLRSHDPAQLAKNPYAYYKNENDPSRGVVGASGNALALDLSNPSLLLDREPGTAVAPLGTSFDEDVPVFELPRAPLLSVAQLQHLSLPAQLPFWVGQSAASAGPAEWNNSLFDQYFFSGLGKGVDWATLSLPLPTTPLPNTLARVLRRKPDGTDVSSADFAAKGTITYTPPPPDDPALPTPDPVRAVGLSAKYLLQGGAFNLNSTEPDAWAAVLRSVRFPTGREFTYLNADPATGTAPEGTTATLATDATFPRFSQSAQETYLSTAATYAQSEPVGLSTNTIVRTDAYRQGFRSLTTDQVTALANKITDLVKARFGHSGPGVPFRSVEEFLNPTLTTKTEPDPADPTGVATITTTTTGPSLLEQAIVDLNLNADLVDASLVRPFSSSFLTQADIMTALAPVLFVRSDTFTVRAYGEVNNPITGATEGKAWCEAVVQRFPEPFAPAAPNQPTDDEYKAPPGTTGRRFKIVSFRWLTRSDI